MRQRIGLMLLSLVGGLSGRARAADVDGSDLLVTTNHVVNHAPLKQAADYAADALMARVLVAEKESVLACFAGSQADWNGVFALAQTLVTRVAAAKEAQSQQEKLQSAQAAFKVADTKLSRAKERAADAQVAVDVWSKRTDPQATQPTIDAQKELLAANAAKDAATTDLATATQALDDATKTLAATGGTAKAAPVDVKAARDAFVIALDSIQARRSPRAFREALADKTRRDACKKYNGALNVAFSGADVVAPQLQKEQQDARVKARVDDTIGKTTGTASALTGASNTVEQPGAPDRVVYTIMSALGADSKIIGSQLLMTLNLASVGRSDTTKPVESPLLRNLFLRVGLPLQKTDDGSQATASTTPAGPQVTRMSFVLGGSLFDDSDPRLPNYDECFDFARTYVPFSPDVSSDDKRVDERQLYYATCAQIAANSARLAWRAALGLITTDAPGQHETEPEIAAGALVYGPSDWIYFNLIAQHLRLPYTVNTFGGGFSMYIDAGGDKPGSQWGRLAIDALILGAFRPQNAILGLERSTSWESRISLTASGKVATGGVAQFSLGPRIASSGDVGLFSTVALTYDADTLINTLLTPPANSQ